MEEWELTGQTKEEGNSELTEDEQAKEGDSELEEDFFYCATSVWYTMIVAIFLGPK